MERGGDRVLEAHGRFTQGSGSRIGSFRTGARAIVNEAGEQITCADFEEALSALRAQIDALQLPQPSREVVDSDLKKIEAAAGDRPAENPAASGLLSRLVDKLKMVGVVLNAAVGLQEPLTKLATWFHVPLPF